MPNQLQALIPQILSQILDVLRENCVMPAQVNNLYSEEAASQGSMIEIPELGDMQAFPVVPGPYPADAVISDVTAVKRQLNLNNFEAATFRMADKDLFEVANGTRNRAVEKAVQALCRSINSSIFSVYRQVYNVTGVAGTTPFGVNTGVAQEASRMLTSAFAPYRDRRMILNEFAYANALGLGVLQKVNESGSSETLRDAQITRAVGFDWYEDQQVPRHTSTAVAPYAVDAAAVAGATSLVLDNGSGAIPVAPAIGDVFSLPGNIRTYVVTSVATATPTANEITIGISPGLAANYADGAVATFVTTTANSHIANLAFHRDAIAFASRPIIDVPAAGNILEVLPDPQSGLVLRFEVQRGWKETIFSVDCLWGVLLNRPQLAVRILG